MYQRSLKFVINEKTFFVKEEVKLYLLLLRVWISIRFEFSCGKRSINKLNMFESYHRNFYLIILTKKYLENASAFISKSIISLISYFPTNYLVAV